MGKKYWAPKLPGYSITIKCCRASSYPSPDEPIILQCLATKFYQRLGRLYGIEIYSPRPIGFFLKNLQIAPLVFPGETTIQNAVVACLARGGNVYDPFLVLLPNERPRLVDFLALILKQTELLSVAQVEAQGQRTVAIAANNAKSEFLAVA